MQNKILDIRVDFDLSLKDVIDKADEIIKKGIPGQMISTTNPFFIMAAQSDPEFKKIINHSALSIPDGVGVLYANYYLKLISRINKKTFFYPLKAFSIGLLTGIKGYLKKNKLGQTVTGVDLTEGLFELANENKYSIFLLGGRKRNKIGNEINDNYDMASHVADIVMSKYHNIRIIGATSKYNRDKSDDADTLNYIHNCMKYNNVDQIDILLVAYNPVMQEKWIHRNAKEIPVTLSVGIGRTFDYITNIMSPPSQKYVNAHLGWLYTFIKQPWRISRIVKTFPIFPLKIYLKSINHK